MVKPPKEGDPSYKQFMSEKRAILDALHYKAHKVTEKMAEIPGYQCNPVQGAMYAYPMVTVPEGAKRAAKVREPLLSSQQCVNPDPVVLICGFVCT